MSSRRGASRGRLRLLVDTSFLLPAMGIDTDREVVEAISHFYTAEIYYSEVSILEAMWKIVKVIPPGKIDRVREGGCDNGDLQASQHPP